MTVILVWVCLVSKLAGVASSLFTIGALGGFDGTIASPDRLALADMLTAWSSGLGLLAFAAAGIAVLRWIFLTNRNAQTFSDQVEMTPGWAVGWFFVPVAGLFKPFQGVSATWRATVSPETIDGVATPAILRWWWGLWIATSLWGNIEARLTLSATTAEQLIASHAVAVTGILIDIPLTVVLTKVIRRLSAMQRQRLA